MFSNLQKWEVEISKNFFKTQVFFSNSKCYNQLFVDYIYDTLGDLFINDQELSRILHIIQLGSSLNNFKLLQNS